MLDPSKILIELDVIYRVNIHDILRIDVDLVSTTLFVVLYRTSPRSGPRI